MMKRTNLRAVYKGEVRNDSRKKKVLNMTYEPAEIGTLQSGLLYDLELDCGKDSRIIALVKLPENLKLKYDSVHEFLEDWCDINAH